MIKNIGKVFPVLLSGILFSFSWHPNNTATCIFAFIGFAPLFYSILRNRLKPVSFALYTFISLLIWNVSTTWWIVNSTFWGAILANVLNSMLMLIPLLLTYYTHRRFKTLVVTSFIFILSWLSFEYFHLNWDGSWTWLNLGNVFAGVPSLVQWYEYTGAAGGSLWILCSNVLLANIFYNKFRQVIRKHLAFWIVLCAPMLFSLLLSSTKNNTKAIINTIDRDSLNFLVIQPSINPYTEKYDDNSKIKILTKLIQLSEDKLDSTIDVVVWPETSIPYNMFEQKLPSHYGLASLRDFIDKNSHVQIIAGLISYNFIDVNSTKPSKRKLNDKLYYEIFNTTLLIDSTKTYPVRHKSKLTPGVEVMPLSNYLSFISQLTFDLGGVTGSLGVDDSIINFSVSKEHYPIAPLICYENNYGEYITEFVKKGAGVICLISNDGWWGNTPGYIQHTYLSRLRAIETQRWIVQSSNTGISCFISPSGEIHDSKGWYEVSAFTKKIPFSKEITFYTLHGDWIYRTALWLFVLNIIVLTVLYIFRGIKNILK